MTLQVLFAVVRQRSEPVQIEGFLPPAPAAKKSDERNRSKARKEGDLR